jgi:hypothetical protein
MRFASFDVIANDQFHWATLFHGDGVAIDGRKSSPTSSDATLPEAARWMGFPVGMQANIGNRVVSQWAQELWEITRGGPGKADFLSGDREVVEGLVVWSQPAGFKFRPHASGKSIDAET